LHPGESRDSGFDAPHHPGMTAEKKAARAALRDRWKPRALWKEEVGSLLFSADVNAVTSDVD